MNISISILLFPSWSWQFIIHHLQAHYAARNLSLGTTRVPKTTTKVKLVNQQIEKIRSQRVTKSNECLQLLSLSAKSGLEDNGMFLEWFILVRVKQETLVYIHVISVFSCAFLFTSSSTDSPQLISSVKSILRRQRVYCTCCGWNHWSGAQVWGHKLRQMIVFMIAFSKEKKTVPSLVFWVVWGLARNML